MTDQQLSTLLAARDELLAAHAATHANPDELMSYVAFNKALQRFTDVLHETNPGVYHTLLADILAKDAA